MIELTNLKTILMEKTILSTEKFQECFQNAILLRLHLKNNIFL
jgi:hypothetical protein